jgi:hypothetical protein
METPNRRVAYSFEGLAWSEAMRKLEARKEDL